MCTKTNAYNVLICFSRILREDKTIIDLLLRILCRFTVNRVKLRLDQRNFVDN